MPVEKILNIAIVGGGIGGLCTAIGLLKYPHINVQIYEAAHKFSEVGAGVAFGPNSQRAMQLIDPKIYERFDSDATRLKWPGREKQWFQFRMGMAGDRAEQVIATVTNDDGHTSIHRAVFLDKLVSLVPPEIAHFGKRLDKIIDDGSDGVKLHFQDGEVITVDGVISADGVHSPTRKYLLGDNHPAANPVFTGHTFIRGLLPMEEAAAVIDREYAANTFIWPVAPHGLVMHYPIDQGKTLNVACMKDVPTWEDPKWIVPITEEEVLNSFKGVAHTPQEIIKLVAKAKNVAQWAIFDYPAAPYFNKGRVCMMGDAAHASTPFQGAGAGMAIEDALVLSRLMAGVTDKSQIPDAFKAYDSVRRERACKVTTTSRQGGINMVVPPDEPGRVTEKALINQYVHGMSWLWDIDLNAHVEDALRNFDKYQAQ